MDNMVINVDTVKINGTYVDILNNGYSHGLHVVVVNQTSGAVTHREVYDTSAAVNQLSDHFKNLIASQRSGTIVAIAIKDRAIDIVRVSKESLREHWKCTYTSGKAWRLMGHHR